MAFFGSAQFPMIFVFLPVIFLGAFCHKCMFSLLKSTLKDRSFDAHIYIFWLRYLIHFANFEAKNEVFVRNG
jgi:hypothetical protein